MSPFRLTDDSLHLPRLTHRSNYGTGKMESRLPAQSLESVTNGVGFWRR